MTYNDLVAALDWERVEAAVVSVAGLSVADRADVAQMTLAALGRWGAADFVGFRVRGVEERFLANTTSAGWSTLIADGVTLAEREKELTNASVTPCLKGYFDLTGFVGEDLVCVDWKTGWLKPETGQRLRDSKQHVVYCELGAFDRFEYRFVQRDGRTKSFPLSRGAEREFNSYVDGVFLMRRALHGSPFWPQHAYACNAYGRECEHYRVCRVEKKPPAGGTELRPLSFSRAEEFLLCPERYRLSVVRRGEGELDETPESRVGSAFHAAVACVWTQIGELQRKENGA